MTSGKRRMKSGYETGLLGSIESSGLVTRNWGVVYLVARDDPRGRDGIKILTEVRLSVLLTPQMEYTKGRASLTLGHIG